MNLELKGQNRTFLKEKLPLQRLREHIQDLLKTYPDLKAGVTGEDALSIDEMTQAFRDMRFATITALIGIGILFMLVFRQIYNPLLVLFSLVVAICWTFGWLTLVIGHLTILSVAFTPILLGLGVDFGIHLLARFNEERDRGMPFDRALNHTFQRTGNAVAAGAFTTALTFYAIMLADFKGIQELGFIAGSGVLLSLLATFTVLPSMLTLLETKRTSNTKRNHRMRPDLQFMEIIFKHRGGILVGVFFISCLSAVAVGRVYFDYNLLNLQAEGTESVEWEKKVTEHSDRSSWYALTTASSLAAARKKEKLFKTLPSVRKVDSLSDLIPEDQQNRIRAVTALGPLVEDYEFELSETEPLDSDHILELLEKIKFKLRVDVEWDPQKKPDDREILMTRQALLELVELMKQSDSETIEEKLKPFENKLFKDFEKKFRLIKDNVHPSGPITENDLPKALYKQLKGKNGHYLLRVFSKENIWEKEPMKEFADQLQAVEPDITGSPIIGYIAINLMRKGYLQAFVYAFLCILIVVWAMFRKIREALLTMIPLALTTIWLLGWMGWVGIAFNLANVIALPLILGIVIDDGIHVVHRYRENPGYVRSLVFGSTAHAISLTSWTTMIGFGSLLVSGHYGIFTLGLLITVAVGIAWFLSLILLPVLLSVGKNDK
jgi:hopanoid biosynthesis associated RND transporter like protein HpnN